jgi:adenylate cyclase class 2
MHRPHVGRAFLSAISEAITPRYSSRNESPLLTRKAPAMLEIEVKYLAPNRPALEGKLSALGARQLEEHQEADHYFNAPDRDFRKTDEAFRIRRIGAKNFVTYKGPRQEGPTKTRPEIEVPLAEGDAVANDLARLLGHLGYRPVAIVRKSRRVYDLEREGFDVHISLDDVDQVGAYAEVEIVAEETQADAARAVVLALATELGLSNPERRSYLQLSLERIGQTS